MTTVASPWLIDVAGGSILLRLVPFYLARLHGADVIPDSSAESPGLPFPFIHGANPIDIVLKNGMTPAAIARYGGGFEPNSSLGSTSWWRWAAYACTPFGWVAFPTPFFTDGVLTALSLQRYGGSPRENFGAIDSWLHREIGDPASTSADASRIWQFGWGVVTLAFEARDHEAELRIDWQSR